MSLILSLQFVTFALITVLGLFVLSKNPRSATNQFFSLFALGTAGWNLCLFLAISELAQPLLFGKLGFSFGALMPVGLFLFSSVFPFVDQRLRYKQWLLGILGSFFSSFHLPAS